MSSASSAVDLFGLDPATWTRPMLHAGDRVWTETNCYVDLWAELLPALGHPAEAALSAPTTTRYPSLISPVSWRTSGAPSPETGFPPDITYFPHFAQGFSPGTNCK